MRYYSTRDAGRKSMYSLKDASFMGLAPDGGLFMPEYIPRVDLEQVLLAAYSSYADMAVYLASLFFGEEFSSDVMRSLVQRAYNFSCPLRRLDDDLWILELFHGPTCAFKDFGARFMGAVLGQLREGDEHLTVLTATSGDTGSAVAAGFHGVPGVNVVVLYPKGKVSNLQESQMTTLGGNICAVQVDGTFDDCQALVKQLFNDKVFRATHNITSANSINLLRWIPQSFYYFYAWTQWYKATGRMAPDVVVPSGNYGNITAGMLAARMGLPVRRFICASNANDVVPQYLASGVYRPRPSVCTIANAMDVGAPSNYERMMCLYGNNYQELCSSLYGWSCSDDDIRSGIAAIYQRYGYVSDPHTTTGWLAAQHYAARGFSLSTAHPAKFQEVIAPVLHRDVEVPETLRHVMNKQKAFTCIGVDACQLKKLIHKVVALSFTTVNDIDDGRPMG
ncbi:MAG: threonine synthase [Bacteroidales bacterium]|nr:threonine synthase [Bacteroidales bacterium]